MKIKITDKTLLNWKYFSSPERVHVLLLLAILADEDGLLGIDIDRISCLTRLMSTTVRRCINDFKQDSILVKESDKYRLHLHMGITPLTPQSPSTPIIESLSIPISESPSTSIPIPNRFTPPSIEEVADYVKQKGYHFDSEVFWHFYDSKGWMVGKNKMKKWHSACVTFEKRELMKQRQYNQSKTNQYERNRNQARASYLAAEVRTDVSSGGQTFLNLIPER